MDTHPGTAPHPSNALLVAAVTFGVCVAAAALVPIIGARLDRGWQVVLEALVITALVVPVAARVLRQPAQRSAPADSPGKSTVEKVDWPVTDARTGAFSRRGITVALLEYMALAGRYHRPISVALVGLEDAETIDANLGRTARDTVIENVAATIADVLRMPDRVGSLEDGTFLVVLPETGVLEAQVLAERIQSVVTAGEVVVAPNQRLQVRVSTGVTEFRSGEDMHQLMARAGRALDAARGSGSVHVLRSRAA